MVTSTITTPMNTAVITANEALTFLQKTIERSDTKRFAVITDIHAGRITLEPFYDDDTTPFYELSPEGEASLRVAMREEVQGLGRPISELRL